MIDEYIYNILNMMLTQSEILSKERSFKLSYLYLKKAYEICQVFQSSKVIFIFYSKNIRNYIKKNPDIIHSCIKCYFLFAKFFFQFNK